jgi:hypothetical protein
VVIKGVESYMEEQSNKTKYKEYIGLYGDRFEFAKKIEGSIIPLIGGLLDYIEVMFESLGINEEEAKRAFNVVRKKVLRDGNDCVRDLIKEIHLYQIKILSKDVIKIKD